MEISEMNLIQIEERLAALDVEVRDATELAAVEAAKEEKAKLLERKAELDAIEQRKAAAAALESGETTAEKITAIKAEEERTMFSVESIEYRNAWVKKLVGKDMSVEERDALASAGAVIPTMTVNAVWDKLIKPAELLGKVAISQFPNYVRFPVATAVAAATSGAVGGTITESSDTIGYVDLVPNEYVKALTVGADIDHMAIDAIHGWIVDNLTNSIRYAINKDILVGTGTNSLKGLTASVEASATAIPATLTVKSLLGIMGSLGGNYQNGAVWIMTPSMFYSEVMSLSGLQDYVINDGFQFKLFGHDVVLMSEALVSSKENIFYGDPAAYKVNIFKALEVKPFETASTTNITFRGATMADGELLDTNAFVRAARA